ncbi:thioredoxin family protein [Deinococcus sp. 14RED07]|uniref:thioredoxin family protein n=1 Tax=Deinococcus sp. 14RED07 TaxID=2745874 RepID=UPI001E2F86D7|nr:thioredoxin family protein [Deinococcus sp. 14RED07]MCD0175652.1 thioredoxin family protein [Deinococcus sp. 14RED07]
MSAQLQVLTDLTFEDQVSHGHWVVYFWSATCRPCAVVRPVIEDLAALHGASVRVGTVNVDTELRTAITNRVMGVPTVILFRDGLPVECLQTTYPPQVYHRLVQQHLLS